MTTALVLAGAVAKGAFEAGALSVLAERGIDVGAIVATSAGALNAALLGTGLRRGHASLAADTLLALWREEATWTSVLRPTLRGLFDHTGFSSVSALQDIVQSGMETIARAAAPGSLHEIRVKLVTTALNGEQRSKGGIEATTFEHVVDFGDADFDSEHGRKRVAEAALASSAFPVLFVPVPLAGVGPCIDGGAVNNAPISWAIDLGADHVIVVTGDPLHTPGDHELRGLELLGKEVDIAINERLFRDLRQARRVNEKLDDLDAAFRRLNLDDAQRAQILGTLGWKKLRVTEIRPTRPLPGNAFSALGSAELRSEYIALGREAAERSL